MKKTNHPLKILLILVGVIAVAFGALAIFVSTLDADKYRPQLVDILSKKTGRTVKLSGPIKFSLGLNGITVSIQDAAIGNPSWASRPLMAGMGKFELGIGLLPLLAERISVNKLAVENADILLETNAAGQHNWDFNTTTGAPASAPTPVKSSSGAASSTSASLSIESLSITNSQLAMRDATGKPSSYNLASLQLTMHSTGAELTIKGDVNNAPIVADIKTSIHDLLSKNSFTFDADATYNALHFAAKGMADIGASKADISSYELNAGKTKMSGDLSANWGGARPSVRGTLTSDHLDPADFKNEGGETANEKPTSSSGQPAPSNGHVFSDAALPFGALKSADADLSVSIGEFVAGKSALKQITAKLALANGDLVLSPVKAKIGDAPVDVQLKLSAAQSPPHLTIGVKADSVDLGELQKLGGMSPFMTGKAGADIELAGEGNSAHEIASSLGGVITITAEKGEILTGAASGISSTLAALFAGAGSDDALNCLAARFIVKNGILTDNGMLINSAASVVAGTGSANLALETVNMTMRAKTKLIDVGGLVPAMDIGGTLAHPTYTVDATGVVKNVVSNLINGNVDVISSTVPDIQTAPAGQNACVYTLDHPKKQDASGPLSPAGTVSGASQKIQNIGNSLVKGLFGK